GTYNAYNQVGTGAQLSPSGAFITDNQLFPSGVPQLDYWGLLFLDNAGIEINIWGNSGPHDYSGYSWTNGVGYTYTGAAIGTFTLTMVPLPTIAGMGLGGLAGMATLSTLRRRRA